ncbi:MAG: arylamine N-acetyltransferase, partial [Deltaproteobacteria bacterium]|nr:arylamine N-acetyltransferase [Deltaproteobacteria bacterium]
EKGRITLTDSHFKVSNNGDVTETEIKDEGQFKRYLEEYFGLDLDSIKPE